MSHQILQPPHWPRPRGYSNGVAASGRQVFLGGQIGWDEHGKFAGPDLASQVRKALSNIVEVLAQAGGAPEHLVRLTWYVTRMEDYRSHIVAIGKAYQDIMGKVFPPMSVVQVVSLVEPEACVEIEATAVVPDLRHR